MFPCRMFACVLIVALDCLPSIAQSVQDSDCGCHLALAKDISSTVLTESEEVRFLQVIDQHIYEEARSKVDLRSEFQWLMIFSPFLVVGTIFKRTNLTI